MGFQSGPTDNRGLSEIYGTVLIISLVLVTAVALAGVGFYVLNDTTSDANDRLAQDSVLELDDRLTQLTNDQVENSAVWEIPQGTGEDFDADGAQGTINVTARTNETYWDASASDGGLVSADSQTNFTEVSLGTITHESNDGVLTVYQGGGVFRIDGDAVTVLREPNIDVVDTDSGESLALNFINISSVQRINEGEELTASQPSETVDADQVQAVVDAAMRDETGAVVAPAEINMTITSEYAEGWAAFAEERLDSGRDIDVWTSDDLGELGANQIKLGFGEFGGGVLPVDREYDDDIVYTGLSQYADKLYNESEGEIEDSGSGAAFSVEKPGDYLVGMLYQTDDSYEWYVWDPEEPSDPEIMGYDDKWVSAEEPDPHKRVLGDGETPDVVDGVTGDEFEIDPGTWVTAINVTDKDRSLETFREYLPSKFDETSPDNGILTNPVEVSEPAEQTGEYAPYYEIDGFDAEVINTTSGSTASGPGPYTVGKHGIDLEVNGTNRGSSDGDGVPVALIWDRGNKSRAIDMADPGFVTAARNDTALYDEFDLTGTLDPWGTGTYAVSGSTAHDDVPEGNRSWFPFENASFNGEFEVEIQDVDNTNGDGETIVEGSGEEVEVEVEIENNRSSKATQPIYLRYDDGDPNSEILDAQTVTIDGDDDETITLSWAPREGAADENKINVTSDDDADQHALTVRDADSVTANFEIDSDDISEYDGKEIERGSSLGISFDVENAGDIAGKQSVLLRNETTGDPFDGENIRLNSSGETTVGLDWVADTVGEQQLRVETDDDVETFTVDVTPRETNSEYDVDIATLSPGPSVSVGDRLEVNVTVNNLGDEEDTKAVWLENHTDEQVDVTEVTVGGNSETQIELVWEPRPSEVGEGNITVKSPDDQDTRTVEVVEQEDAEPEFNATITDIDGVVTEGEPINVTATVENVGDAAGETNLILENIDGDPVNVTNTGEIEPGPENAVTVELTWFTLIGDAGDDPPAEGNVSVTGEGTTDSAAVNIEERVGDRPPVDVAFALDETGSMGRPVDDPYWGQFMDKGDTFELDASDGPGERTVPAGDNVWMGPADECESDTDIASTDCEFFVSGQTISPQDRWGEQTVELHDIQYPVENDPDSCSLCYDAWGDRYFAVENALDALDKENDQAGLVDFHTLIPGDARTYQGMTSDLQAVRESLRINPGWGTNIVAGYAEAQSLLNDEGRAENEDYIILLTDGEHNSGYFDDADNEYALENIDDETTVYTVGFGNANEDELTAIAEEGGTGNGTYIEAENSEELEGIFEGLVENITDDEPPEYTIQNAEVVGSSTVEEGETITVEADITNAGEGVADQPILLFDTGFNGFPVDGTVERIEPTDDPQRVQLQWDTSDTVDWENESVDDKTGQVTVDTPSDTATLDVTIEEPPEPEYRVNITGTNTSPETPLTAGEGTLEIDVDVTNVGDASGEQDIFLRRGDGSPTPAGTTVNIPPGETRSATIEWEVPLRDAAVDEVTVVTEDGNSDSERVYIEPPEIESSAFDISVESVDSEVLPGAVVDVTANVTNVGETADDVILRLFDFDGDPSDAARTPTLDPGQSEEFTLGWPTDPDAATRTGNVTVEAGENATQAEVSITGRGDGTFVIDSVETNADDGDEFIHYQNRPLNVTAEITNEGDDALEEIELLDGVGNELAVAMRYIDSGDTETVTFEWQPNTDGVDEIQVQTREERADQSVDIRSLDGPETIKFESVTTNATEDDAVEAGERVGVDVEINASSDIDDAIIGLEAQLGGGDTVGIDWKRVDLDESGTNAIEFTWETEPRFGDDDSPWTVRAYALGAEGTGDAWLDEVPETDPESGIGPTADPVGIDIDEIAIS